MDFFGAAARSETVVVSLWAQENTSCILHCIIDSNFSNIRAGKRVTSYSI